MSEGHLLSPLSPSSRNARRTISYNNNNPAAAAHSTVDDAPVNFGEGFTSVAAPQLLAL